MNYRDAFSLLQEGRLPHKLLFEGPEPYLVEDFLKKIMNYYQLSPEQPFHVLRQDGADFNREEFQSFVQMLPMFSDVRMAVVEQAQKLSEDADFWRMLKELEDESLILCFLVEEKKEAAKEIGRFCETVSMKKITRREMEQWIAKQFRLLGKKVSLENIQRIIEQVGYFEYGSSVDLYYVLSEIEKLSATEQEIIDETRIQSLLGKPLEENVFQLLQTILEGHRDKTMMLYREYLQSGASLYRILPMLVRNFYQVHLLKQLSQRNHVHGMMMTLSGVRSEFVLKKLLGAARRHEEEALLKKLELCLEYEKIYKSESVDIKDHLEHLFLELMQ